MWSRNGLHGLGSTLNPRSRISSSNCLNNPLSMQMAANQGRIFFSSTSPTDFLSNGSKTG